MIKSHPPKTWRSTRLAGVVLLVAARQMLGLDIATEGYFKAETARLSGSCLNNIHTLAEWQARRPGLCREAAEMLGLDPMPERTQLKPVITGTLNEDAFTVEKLYFQSRPHLYVTANLYLPKRLTKPAPAILYLCGHTLVMTNEISCGNKTAYQQHGIWFARNGYVCLIIDTLDLGEIRGIHRGTYSEKMWWWNARGYTPAGVETWNAMRALDYLASRPEVDAERIGVTGRSGGGAYSWFLAALDDRVKVIAPVAGIADLHSYVVDGTVDRHCDCMFLVNTYRWDYPMLAALCAPRPLLLANTDADEYFPLSGVMRTHDEVAQIYDLYHASTNFGLAIGPGPHRDTPEMQAPVFHWFGLHLKHEETKSEMAAVKMFPPLALKVFDKIPNDQINTRIQESFVAAAPCPETPVTLTAWRALRDGWMKDLRAKCFAGWPDESSPPVVVRLSSEESEGVVCDVYEIHSQPFVSPRICVVRKATVKKPREIVLRIVDGPLSAGADARKTMDRFGPAGEAAQAVFAPRDAGPASEEAQLRRRYMLVGQTLDGMRVWDIRRAVQALRAMGGFEDVPIRLEAEGTIGVNALYASLFEPGISGLDLHRMPSSHAEGPDYLNVLKILDIPQAAAMAASRCSLRLGTSQTEGWEFLKTMAKSTALGLRVEWVK